MVLLIAFAFVAGVGTALSPCVLPVLPIALSAGATGGARRPLGIVTGLALSFTFATVALVYLIHALGLPDDLLRMIAIAGLVAFGAALMVPQLAARIEARLSRLVRAQPGARAGRSGFGSGLLVGAGLGLVYAPCAGPILAGVITVSASQTFSAGRLATALAYGAGSAAALYVLMLGGRRLARRLARRSVRVQQVLGGVMVVVGLLMLANLDMRFQTAVASDLPGFLVNPTGGLERSHAISRRLAAVRGQAHGVGSAAPHPAGAGGRLPSYGPAPEFTGTQRWFNTPGGQPLTIAGLRLQHRVVLVDFWTYTCINCIRTLPQLEAWDARYRRAGLTIVGVHTPEFPFERDASNVAAAIARDGIHYPVVQDNLQATWNAYANQYWPAEYLIDANGQVRHVHFGEGDYGKTEQAIRTLLAEAGSTRLGAMTHPRLQLPSAGLVTPETYLGSARAQGFANGPIADGAHDYGGDPGRLPLNAFAYGGRWTISPEAAASGAGARIYATFRARRVFLVAGAAAGARGVGVRLDGRPLGAVRVSGQRLYPVVQLPRVGTHRLELDVPAGVRAYSFTFG